MTRPISEERKKREIDFYDIQAKKLKERHASDAATDFEGFSPAELSSFKFCYRLVSERAGGAVLLDYGCGNGVHTGFLAGVAAKVVGIDLSEASLAIAKERIKKAGLESKTDFMAMDCEQLDFPGGSFDIIFDGGTFSSLDLDRALPELARVLKPGGSVIGIETFGHNPITNFKRSLKAKTGGRTAWAASHIFTMDDYAKAGRYFAKTEAYFFHLVSWAVFPLLNLPGGRNLLRAVEAVERPFLKAPLFRRWAFKTVFVFSKPIR